MSYWSRQGPLVTTGHDLASTTNEGRIERIRDIRNPRARLFSRGARHPADWGGTSSG
jgi:hypothetical protein